MSLERIIAAGVTLIQDVPGIGHLHHYERLMIPPEDVQSVFGIDDLTSTRGWSLQSTEWFRQGVTEERSALDGMAVAVTHHLGVRVYKEHNDAWQSGVQFRRQVDAIRALLRVPGALEPEAVITTAPQMTGEGRETLVVLGDTYLCHQAIITVDAQELVYLDEQGTWMSYSNYDNAYG